MINLFKEKPVVDTITAIEQESEASVNIFIETMEKLETVNKKITEEEALRADKIRALVEEQGKLAKRKKRNVVFLDKMGTFLGEMPAVSPDEDQDSRDEETNSEA